MQYIAHRRFKGKAMCGEVNIPAMTVCEEIDNVIYCQGHPICYATSENGHQFFARDDDGNGMLRGALTQSIQKTLEQHDEDHQSRWEKVWEDETCQAYKRKEHGDHWLWNHSFFNAEILTLRHIATVVGAKEG